LALGANHRCHKEQLLDLLWPDLDLAAAANNLHKTLYFLRHILCPTAADARQCPYVEFDGETVALAPHLIAQVDVEQFEARAAEALASADATRYTAALALYTGDLLPDDLYEDWTIPRRADLRQTYLALLRGLGDLHLARRDYEQAIAAWQRLLAVEPADEDVHQALLRAYALSGQRHQALRQYHLCRQALASELDAKPLPETVSLYEAILAGEIAPQPTPALALPLSPVPYRLIGREAEMATLLAGLDQATESGPRLALIAGEAGGR
jgi:DNA-binding SARP family transcriptional activator